MTKRKLLTIAVSFVMASIAAPAFADADNTEEHCLSYDPDMCCITSCCCNWGVYADWLYWRTRRGDLDYAVPADSDDPYLGHIKEVCLDWDSGFRFGIFTNRCDYDFGVHFTHYENDESNTTTTPAGGLVKTRVGNQISDTTDSLLQYAKGSYCLDLDSVDIEAGYALSFENCAYGRIFTGFRWAEIDQHLTSRYAEDPDDTEGVSNPVDIVKQTIDLDAYGIYLGGQFAYDWNCCLSLFGKFSYGFLAGDIDRKYVAKGTDGVSVSSFTTHANLKDSCWKLLSNVDLTLGLNYHICATSCGSLDFGFGYEFHQWINVPDFLNFVTGDTSGEVHIDHNNDSLGFDGFYLRLAATF